MENLNFQPDPQIDLNQIANHFINQITKKATARILSEVKELLNNHFSQKEDKIIYYTQKQACERLGISRSALYQREKKGLIVRDGSNGRPLYSHNQIDNYLKSVDKDRGANGFSNHLN